MMEITMVLAHLDDDHEIYIRADLITRISTFEGGSMIHTTIPDPLGGVMSYRVTDQPFHLVHRMKTPHE